MRRRSIGRRQFGTRFHQGRGRRGKRQRKQYRTQTAERGRTCSGTGASPDNPIRLRSSSNLGHSVHKQRTEEFWTAKSDSHCTVKVRQLAGTSAPKSAPLPGLSGRSGSGREDGDKQSIQAGQRSQSTGVSLRRTVHGQIVSEAEFPSPASLTAKILKLIRRLLSVSNVTSIKYPAAAGISVCHRNASTGMEGWPTIEQRPQIGWIGVCGAGRAVGDVSTASRAKL